MANTVTLQQFDCLYFNSSVTFKYFPGIEISDKISQVSNTAQTKYKRIGNRLINGTARWLKRSGRILLVYFFKAIKSKYIYVDKPYIVIDNRTW